MRDWFASGARQSIYRTPMDVPRESYKFAMHHSTAFCDHDMYYYSGQYATPLRHFYIQRFADADGRRKPFQVT